MRVLAAVALLATAALAGCAGTGKDPFAPSADGTTTGSQPTAGAGGNVTKAKPVTLGDEGDMLEAGTKDFSWDVAPGWQTLTVSLYLSGPSGAPTYVANNVACQLWGNGTQIECPPDGDGVASQAGAQTCSFCYDAAEDSSLAHPEGAWNFHLGWDPSPAHYRIEVVVDY